MLDTYRGINNQIILSLFHYFKNASKKPLHLREPSVIFGKLPTKNQTTFSLLYDFLPSKNDVALFLLKNRNNIHCVCQKDNHLKFKACFRSDSHEDTTG